MTHSRFRGRAVASTLALFAVTSFCTALAFSSHAPPSPPPATPVDEAVLHSPFQVNATADVTYLAALPPEQLHCAGFRATLVGKRPQQGHPLDCRFDHFFGFLGGAANQFSGSKHYRLDRAPFTDFGPA